MMKSMFEDMLRQAAREAGQAERAKPGILPEAAVARLKELLPAYTADAVSFAPGDLVTPRRDATVKSAGKPHLVVAVLSGNDRQYRFDQGENGSNGWGMRVDLRVIHLDGEHVVAHWVESAAFETYREQADA